MEKKRHFSKLTTTAASLNQQVDFVRAYAKNKHGHPYQEVTVDNFMQILSGEHLWQQFNDDQKLIINGILMAGEGRNYEELVKDARKLKERSDDYLQMYMMDHHGSCYQEVMPENYEQILSGKREWKIMTEDIRQITDAVLISLSKHSYEQFLKEAVALKNTVENFLQRYVCGEAGVLYDHVDPNNYEHILSGEKAYRALSKKEQRCIDLSLEYTGYEQLLNMAQLLKNSTDSFVKVYVSQKSGELYERVTVDNYEQILSGWNFWKKLSKDQKQLIDQRLKEYDCKVYENMVLDAKDIDMQIKRFLQTYAMDGNRQLWQKVSAENYTQILSGAVEWNELEAEVQQAVNRVLARQGVDPFEHMLMDALDLQENILEFVTTYSEKERSSVCGKDDRQEIDSAMDEFSKEELDALKARLKEEQEQASKSIQPKQSSQSIKPENKPYKTPVAVCGMLSIAAIALLGKKKKK